MRDEDADETAMAARHNELRDIHHRIDALKEEGERQYSSLTEKLHALEVAVVRGGKFPPAAWVAAIGLGLTIVATGATLFAKLETTHILAQQAVDAIRGHITEMAPAENIVWTLDERVKGLESRIVGQGPNGWHRADHNLYAEGVDTRFKGLEHRVGVIEAAQAALCARVSTCKVAK